MAIRWAAVFLALLLSIAFVHCEEHKGHKATHNNNNNGGEKEESEGDLGIAVMLMGSIAFQLSLFYLVNHPDKDMKKYSWETISQTISIFLAVLIFQGFNGIVDHYAIEHSSLFMKEVFDLLHMLGWVVILQLTLYFSSGAHKKEHSESEIGHSTHSRAKSASILLAHVTGFASMNFWGGLQGFSFFASSPLMSLMAVPAAFLGMIGLYHVTDNIRESHAAADNSKDEWEILWDEETEEAEHDIMGLTVSFLITQTLRFWISGQLPNKEGVDKGEHTLMQAFHLLMCALVAVVGVLGFGKWHKHLEAIPGTSMKERAVTSLSIISSMVFAWCLLYSTKWALSTVHYETLREGIFGKVVVAIVVSALSFILIFFLDKLADSEKTSDAVDELIVIVIGSFGIMIGFSWEQSFDTGVEVIAEAFSEESKHWMQLLITLMLAGVVLPAWKWYILPNLLHASHHGGGHAEHGHCPIHGHSEETRLLLSEGGKTKH
jgi:uncharacterized membrane protein